MEWLGWIAIGVFLVYFFTRKSSGPAGTSPQTVAPSDGTASQSVKAPPQDDVAFLRVRWAEAQKERDSGVPSTFPHWFFDEATERQLSTLQKSGIKVSGPPMSKGAVSDLIGLTRELEEEDLAVLRHFKVPVKDMNQTRGRYAVKELMADPANAAAWESRPATPLQKECLKFFSIPLPRALTAQAAEKLVGELRSNGDEQHQDKWDQWQSFESLVEQLSEKETYDEYDIKKPSLVAIRDAVESLRAEGKTMDELDTDFELVIERMVKLKPELSKVAP